MPWQDARDWAVALRRFVEVGDRSAHREANGRAFKQGKLSSGRIGLHFLLSLFKLSENPSLPGSQFRISERRRIVPEVPYRLFVEEFPEATVIRIRPRLIPGSEEDAIEEILVRVIETGKDRLVLDFTEVEFIGSKSLGRLVKLRRTLSANSKTAKPTDRWIGRFAFFEDRAVAIEAIRQGEAEPLMLCGVRPSLRQLFVICGLSPE